LGNHASSSFSTHYEHLADDELLRLASESNGMRDDARHALLAELRRRGINFEQQLIEVEHKVQARTLPSRPTGLPLADALGFWFFATILGIVCTSAIIVAKGGKLDIQELLAGEISASIFITVIVWVISRAMVPSDWWNPMRVVLAAAVLSGARAVLIAIRVFSRTA
jgi:hypothetical protein